MIAPVCSEDQFLADVRACRALPGFRLWWLGQSGFLLQWNGRHLLLDPYLSDSLTRKYAGTDRPHVRMTERLVDPERLDFIDVVTSSHNHTDHLDADTLHPLLAANPGMAVMAPRANLAFAADRLQVPVERLTGVDDGETVEAAGFTLAAVPSAHETVERDERGACRYLGYVVRFGGWTVYHSGDTVRYPGMAERLHPFAADIAMLPINGHPPDRGVPGNLDGPEAAQLAHDIGADVAIPCHYEMFAFNTASPESFAAAARRLGQPIAILRCGQRWASPASRNAGGSGATLAVVTSVNTGRVRTSADGRYSTAIAKVPAGEPLWAGRLGMAGDVQADRKHHGGPDQAVHAHFRQHLDFWGQLRGRPVAPGEVGENLTLDAAPGTDRAPDEAVFRLGDVVAVGGAILEVARPRQPCFKLADRLGIQDAVRIGTSTGRTGFYFRVLAEGLVASGDEVRLLDRPRPDARLNDGG